MADNNHPHLFIEVDGTDAWPAALEARGVTLQAPPTDRPRGTRDFYVRDDQGHTLCFSQPAAS